MSKHEFARADGLSLLQQATLAVVTPTYKHPYFIADAIESVQSQFFRGSIIHIIVNDGCPFKQTDVVCRAFRHQLPNLIYLRKPNGGPGSARNLGIDFVLRHCPNVDSVFFLDADNKLSVNALQTARDSLESAPGASWVYPNIDTFGISWSGNYSIPYSSLLHIVHDNVCDTGSLVRRSVFEAGVRFDEDSRTGYEDWDFWLRCLKAGHKGTYSPFGFSYRQRAESRNSENNRKRSVTIGHLRSSHKALFRPSNLVKIEHEENPRFGLYDEVGHFAHFFTDVSEINRGEPLAAVPDRYSAAALSPTSIYVPAVCMWGRIDAFAGSMISKLLPGILSSVEIAVSKPQIVAVQLKFGGSALRVFDGKSRGHDWAEETSMLVACSHDFLRWLIANKVNSNGSSASFVTEDIAMHTITVELPDGCDEQIRGVSRFKSNFLTLERMCIAIKQKLTEAESARSWQWRTEVFPVRSEYARVLCENLNVLSVFPKLPNDKLKIALVMPSATYGGADKVSYALAKELSEVGAEVNLFVLGSNDVAFIPDCLKAFSSITIIGDNEIPIWGGPVVSFGQETTLTGQTPRLAKKVSGFLAGHDVVVNCHSAFTNTILGDLRALGMRTVSYVHVSDRSKFGRFVGFPYLGTVFEHGYDLFLSCSNKLSHELESIGIPADKILSIRNAPSFERVDVDAEDVTRLRSRSHEERPLRILYMGRLDRQKGVDRFGKLVQEFRRRNFNCEIRVVGSMMLDDENVDWIEYFRNLGVDVRPPVFSAADLEEQYLWADVFILLSKWEGAPLVIPEAQQYGCITIATDVGAVSEQIVDGVDGILVPTISEGAISHSVIERIVRLSADDDYRKLLSLGAISRASHNTWESNFAPFRNWLSREFPGRISMR